MVADGSEMYIWKRVGRTVVIEMEDLLLRVKDHNRMVILGMGGGSDMSTQLGVNPRRQKSPFAKTAGSFSKKVTNAIAVS